MLPVTGHYWIRRSCWERGLWNIIRVYNEGDVFKMYNFGSELPEIDPPSEFEWGPRIDEPKKCCARDHDDDGNCDQHPVVRHYLRR